MKTGLELYQVLRVNIAKSFYVSLCSVEVQIATNIQGLEEWLFNYQCTSC